MQISLQTRLQTFVSSFLFRYENVAGVTLAIIATFVAGYHLLGALRDQSTGTASQDWIL